MNIVLFADFQCPFCYTGETALQEAIKELGIEDQVYLDIKSREIHRPEDGDGQMPMLEIFQQKEGFNPEGAAKHVEKINAMGKNDAGLDFDFAKVHESSDHDAHRLYKLARDKGLGQAFRDAIHEAYFTNHEILADWDVLKKAAKKAGLDEELVNRALEEGWYENEVKNDEVEYEALKIESIPYCIIDQEVFPDHFSKESAIEALKRHMK